MLALTAENLQNIYAVATKTQFGKPPLVERLNQQRPERFILQDFERNIYIQTQSDKVVFVGNLIRQDNKIMFIDQRNRNQCFTI